MGRIEYMKVLFLRTLPPYKPGDITDLPIELAKPLIKSGIVEEYKEDKEAKAKKARMMRGPKVDK